MTWNKGKWNNESILDKGDRVGAGAGDGGATAVVEPKRVISSFGGLSGGRRRIRLGFGFGSRRIGSSIGGCDFLPLWIAGGE